MGEGQPSATEPPGAKVCVVRRISHTTVVMADKRVHSAWIKFIIAAPGLSSAAHAVRVGRSQTKDTALELLMVTAA
jgi:hypothetical protein